MSPAIGAIGLLLMMGVVWVAIFHLGVACI